MVLYSHEDLSLNPKGEFKKIFEFIDLQFEEKADNYIRESTESKNFKRNSKENVKSWKQRLSEDEIEKIKEGTKEVSQKIYRDKDW